MHAAVPVALLLLQAQLQAAAPRTPADPAAYFQQDVRYTIAARLDEPSGILTASARLIYRNNSPDTLREIYFHLYLNAFRPHSLFADDELRQQIHRFSDLPDPYYAYERLHRVAIGGVPVAAEYPLAPDSTVARFALPAPLPPGDSLVVDLAWEARLSAIPRRQGRSGRHYDFAQWYPKVAVYDADGWEAHALRLQGELYGEVGTFDVTLDLRADQVIGATGVPLEGDPGWTRARAAQARGRKRVRFVAEHVHHFAWAVDPEYVHEEGRYGGVPIHVLYRPEERGTWGGGLALASAIRAMAWLDTIFGAYPYPQVTLLRRIEGGGTEFPMLVMLGDAGESLIFHELGHLYTYGILANNEWKEGWLDEGFTTFQTGWNFRRRGMGVPLASTQQLVLNLDLDGWSRPVVLPAEEYSEQQVYQRMVYTKGQLILEMLRYVLGEETFRRGLREYYARGQLRHVTSDDLRRAMEDVSGQDLRWFFDQWLKRVPRVDYRLAGLNRRREADGGWLTRVVVERRGDGLMPVDIAVGDDDTTLVVRAPGVAARETVEVRTDRRPRRIELDPARQTMDWNYLNNGRGGGRVEHRLGWSGSEPARRDRLVVNWMPLAWYNDAGGVSVGFQSRRNYMGRFARDVVQLTWSTGLEGGGPHPVGWYVALRNPTWLHAPRRTVGLETWALEGRGGARASLVWDKSPHLSFGRRSTIGVELAWMGVTRGTFLSADRWDRAGTVEVTGRAAHLWKEDDRSWAVRIAATGGVVGKGDRRPYVRGGAEVVRRRQAGAFELRARGYVAGYAADGDVPRQRRIFAAGADPYETFLNPLLRSRGAPLARGDVHYQAPGGGGVRALRADLAGRWIAAANVEVSGTVFRRPARRAFGAVSVAAFADAAVGDSAAVGGSARRGAVADFGLGLRAAHRIGPTSFVTRFDVPFLVTRPALAAGARSGDGRLRPRWVWSFEEAF